MHGGRRGQRRGLPAVLVSVLKKLRKEKKRKHEEEKNNQKRCSLLIGVYGEIIIIVVIIIIIINERRIDISLECVKHDSHLDVSSLSPCWRRRKRGRWVSLRPGTEGRNESRASRQLHSLSSSSRPSPFLVRCKIE
jgi:ferric iron reductase protein FhuF